ncbi:thioesterase [Staphylococcus croceilyticus]|uniref:Thioesterase n=1 Tax=Staphylococcus croceilyticus TaxID=319942 RepID=A0ABY2KAZ6_9STAP|nr:thioesterase family protein [Staphylococcus croceilyticus]PNZ66446.1 3-hydroxyacyl-CoA dehydrogenase [Staphylococcus croceilyticus]TGA74334.1 thioesterase [Staphylococcus croceilyticus]
MNYPFIVRKKVEQSQIDHNNHMHDSEYNAVFSEAVNEFNYANGLSLEERKALNYTMFTLEEHTTYLSEMSLDMAFRIIVNIYNYDDKRVHFFLSLYTEDDVLAATNEVMMMGIDGEQRRSAPFPEKYKKNVEQYYSIQGDVDWPKQLGHQIGIPTKKDE